MILQYSGKGRSVMSADEIIDENAIERMISKSYRVVRLIPVEDMSFINEKILEELENGPLSEGELYKKFSNISYALEEILHMEVEAGNIEKFIENNQKHYRITAKGKELLQFRIGRKFLSIE